MNAKLTLTIDKDVIEEAKRYARSENQSLSNLIENFLKHVSRDNISENKTEIHPDIAALRGSVKVSKDFSFNYKKELEEAKDEKFSKYFND